GARVRLTRATPRLQSPTSRGGSRQRAGSARKTQREGSIHRPFLPRNASRIDKHPPPRETARPKGVRMPASYFDVDGTLLTTNLLHPTVFYLLNQQNPLKSMGKLARAALKAPAMALAEMRDRRLFNEMLFTAYEGMSEDRLHC